MKKINIALIAALLVAFASAGFAETAPAGQNKELSEDNWVELAQKYELPAAKTKILAKPTPELVASWWNAFGDETLTNLITSALRNNRDMAVARAKVKEARAMLGGSKARLYPWIDADGMWGKGRKPVHLGGDTNTHESFSLGVDASWEIDIFGGRRADIDAAVKGVEAQYAALHSAWVTLSSEVAINYISLRAYQSRLEVAKKNLALQQDMHDMLQSQYDSGLIDTLALSQEKYVLEQTKASIPPIESAIEQLKNALAVLTGEIPGSLEDSLSVRRAIPEAAELTLVGIPADALRQRPDIRYAERTLMAQMARKKSAQKDLWPKFFLFGSIGTESLTSGSLFEGANKSHSWGPKISWPIFHWGAIKNNIRVQGAKQEQLLAVYEQTVLSAVAEVRNALTENIQERDRNASLKRAVAAAQIALETSTDKYRNGLTDFNNVITAQKAVLSLTDQLIVSEGAISSNIVKIFKSIGGGWQPLAEEVKAGI